MIDASSMIVMPGFVDSHRHIWEGLLRNIGTDVPLEGRSSYISFVLHKLAPAFRPEDAYIGNLISSSARSTPGSRRSWTGPTSRAPRPHRRRDPGAEGLRAACGVRLRLPVVGQVGGAPAELVRPSGDRALLDEGSDAPLALAAPGPEFTDFEVSRDHWKLARETDARITTHVGVGSYGQDAKVQEMGEAGSSAPTPRTSTARR